MSQAAIELPAGKEELLGADTRRRFAWPGWGWTAMGIILIAYAMFLIHSFAPAISEPDDNGYFAQGSLLVQTGRTWFAPESDAQYIGMHWLIMPDGKYISRYPPGLAVVIAAVDAVGGYKAAAFINPALALLALIGLYQLGRIMMSSGWALAAVLLLATNATFTHHALSGDSHIAVTCLLVWGLYGLLRTETDETNWRSLLTGVILGCIPTVRYPDSIMGLAIALYLAMRWWRDPSARRRIMFTLAGAAIPIGALLLRNQLLLGAFWRTGYSLTNEETGFSWEYFREHFFEYISQLEAGGVGALLCLGAAGIAWMICLPNWRRLGITFALIAVPMLLLYMAYYWAPGNAAMTMRFLLPTFPLYALAAMWMLRQALGQAGRGARIAVPLTVIALQLLWGTPDTLAEAERLHGQKDQLARVTDSLINVTNPGDVVVANNQVLQQLDFVRRWKLADASAVMRGGGVGGGFARGGMRGGFGGGAGGPGMGGPGMRGPGMGGPGMGGPGGGGPDSRDDDAPSPMQREKMELLQKRYSGTDSQRREKFANDLTTWAAGQKIYIVATSDEIDQIAQTGHTHIVARIDLPAQDEAGPNRSRRGFGGGGFAGGGFAGAGGFGGMAGGRNRNGFGGPMGGAAQMRGGRLGGNSQDSESQQIVIAEWTPKS